MHRKCIITRYYSKVLLHVSTDTLTRGEQKRRSFLSKSGKHLSKHHIPLWSKQLFLKSDKGIYKWCYAIFIGILESPFIQVFFSKSGKQTPHHIPLCLKRLFSKSDRGSYNWCYATYIGILEATPIYPLSLVYYISHAFCLVFVVNISKWAFHKHTYQGMYYVCMHACMHVCIM